MSSKDLVILTFWWSNALHHRQSLFVRLSELMLYWSPVDDGTNFIYSTWSPDFIFHVCSFFPHVAFAFTYFRRRRNHKYNTGVWWYNDLLIVSCFQVWFPSYACACMKVHICAHAYIYLSSIWFHLNHLLAFEFR